MSRAQWVLAVVALSIGVAHSWDFAVSLGDEIMFYTDDGTKTDTVHLQSRSVGSLAYDEVHNVMLYVDKQNNNDVICGYNLTSKKNVCFKEKSGRNIHSIAYDPATEKLFFTDTNEKSINWLSCENGCKSNLFINLLIDMDGWIPTDIAVDSCSGYIYWFSKDYMKAIERARFNGSGRESLIYDFVDSDSCYSLTVDPRTKKLYYFGELFNNMWSADLNGENGKILIGSQSKAQDLTVTKDYFYWASSSNSYKSVWQLPKNASDGEHPKEVRFYTDKPLSLVANYKIVDLTRGIKDCQSLSRLIPAISAAPRHTGKQCGVPVCANYCLHGSCRVDDRGFPKCSCYAGFSGDRCEVSACHNFCQNDGICSLNKTTKPVCQCKSGYLGERCEVTDCVNYCIQGKCIFSGKGRRTCSCNAGYTGKRCEVSVCHGYCQNDGICSLNKNRKPVCQCKPGYVGDRCEITDCLHYCIEGKCSFSDKGHPTCSCNAGYTGKRCEVSTCHGYCLNGGTCFLNKNSTPVCRCKADYAGDRCEIPNCLNYCIQGKCSLSDAGYPTCSCNAGYTGDRCEVSACHGFCLNGGECSLNEEEEPFCECVGNQDGLRCEIDISTN